MVLRASAGHWQLMAVVPTPMVPKLLPRQPRMRRRKQSVLRRRKRRPKRCWGQSHERAGRLIPQEEGVSKVLREVPNGRALKGLAPQVEGSKRLVADASPQGGNDIPRAPDEHQPAVDVGRRPAYFLHLLRNRQRNLGCASTISRIDVNARQEHRMAIANTSTSIRLDSNLCPSRTRCRLPVPLLLAKRATSPRSLAGTETDASITKRENASAGMHQVRLRFAYLGPL